MRRLAVVTLVLAACTRAPAPPPDDPAVRARSVGVALTERSVSVAAILEAREPLSDVLLAIRLLDPRGRRVAEVDERLPSCAGTCPWAATFDGAQLGREWRRIFSARIRATGTPAPHAVDPLPVPLARRPDGSVVGRAPADGVLCVLVTSGKGAVAGAQVRVRQGEAFRLTEVPRARIEELVGALYPMRFAPSGD